MKIISTVCAINENNRVLMLLRTPLDRTLPNKWCLPGGKCDQDEYPIISCFREVKEETNLDISDVHRVHTDINDKFEIQFFESKHHLGDLKISNEHCDFYWFTKDELINTKDSIAPLTYNFLTTIYKW